jgi:hypothetical protein
MATGNQNSMKKVQMMVPQWLATDIASFFQ